jgi:hypothetical protein
MRGGAIPILAWGTILVVLLAINWIWTGDAIQVGSFGFAALAVYGAAVLVWLTGRDALRRGAPLHRDEIDAVPQASASAAGVGIAIGAMLFGLAWARFLVYFGAGLLAFSLGRLWLEVRAERASRRDGALGERR